MVKLIISIFEYKRDLLGTDIIRRKKSNLFYENIIKFNRVRGKQIARGVEKSIKTGELGFFLNEN